MRRRKAIKRKLIKDAKYNDELVTRFVNYLMRGGKKAVAQKIMYGALARLESRSELVKLLGGSKSDATSSTSSPANSTEVSSNCDELLGSGLDDNSRNVLLLLHKAVESVSPIVEVRSRRVGGATYQVPVEVPANRRQALAIRWLIKHSLKRSEKGMVAKLAAELADAVSGRGESIRKREETYRMAKANQAFAHFAA